MVRGWHRVLLVLVLVGVFLALISPTIPDPLSIPGKNVVVFAVFLLTMFFAHSLIEGGGTPVSLLSEDPLHGSADRIALICSRLC
jgi:hypothetical protein